MDDTKNMARNMIHNKSGYIMGGVLPIIFDSLAFIQNNSFESSWQIAVTIIGLFMLAISFFQVIFVND